VTWKGRNGQIRRILVTPKNPRTDRQLEVRDLPAQQARRFDSLTDAQQNAWNVAAAGFKSTPTLGQSGPLMGLQLFLRINCKLGLLGQTLVNVPPEAPQFPTLAPQNLVITNTGGGVAVRLTCPTEPGESTVLRASPPQNSAIRACRNYRIIGVCPVPVAGAADITGLYTAEYGAVPVGKRILCSPARWWTGSRACRGSSRRGCLPLPDRLPGWQYWGRRRVGDA
jgi:hypothetical protein